VPVRRHATHAIQTDRQGAAACASTAAPGLTARAHGQVPDCASTSVVLASAVPAGRP
jgi:hypothetical protein